MLPIPTPTSREALYQELWTRPIPELLNRYGVCELTFLTTCRRLHLPVPARHLWPRIAAGERFQPPPLRSASSPSPSRTDCWTLTPSSKPPPRRSARSGTPIAPRAPRPTS